MKKYLVEVNGCDLKSFDSEFEARVLKENLTNFFIRNGMYYVVIVKEMVFNA